MYLPFQAQLVRPFNQGSFEAPSWVLPRATLRTAVEEVIRRYRAQAIGVKSSHFLVRALNDAPVYRTNDPNQLASMMQDASRKLGLLGASTYAHRGQPVYGQFYGDGPEYLLAIETAMRPQDIYDNWQDVSAVAPMIHPKSDLSLLVPDAKETSSESGLTIIAIDPIMLAVQFHAFLKHCRTHGGNDSPTRFVHAYVLPNMLKAHIDLAIINRLTYRGNSKHTPPEVYRKHVFALPKMAGSVDTALRHIDIAIQKGDKDVKYMLDSLPVVWGSDASQMLSMPSTFVTRQNDWLMLASRMRYLAWLVEVAGDMFMTRNAHVIYSVRTELTLKDGWSRLRANLLEKDRDEIILAVERISRITGVNLMRKAG